MLPFYQKYTSLLIIIRRPAIFRFIWCLSDMMEDYDCTKDEFSEFASYTCITQYKAMN